jgi:UDP-N-acetylglucosamine 2-epimerase (non-hydrolysing)
MKRILLLVGTRPEAIKMAPVIKAVRDAPDMEAVVVSTGQHRELLQQVIDLFEIEIHHNLAVMQPSQTLESLTASLITSIGNLMRKVKPALALAQGDTTTAFVASLASFYQRIPFGHVEAGLRTGNLQAPFPEEANRRLISVLATLHFAPTDIGRANLLREGISPERVLVTGNTVIDALLMEVRAQQSPANVKKIERSMVQSMGSDWATHPFVLITGHRRENFGPGFAEICAAIAELAARFPTHRFVYPVHPNPNVQRPVYNLLGKKPNIRLIPAVDYRTFIAMLRKCALVLTDSGGVQEEAPSLGKPVLVMRETTERPEGVRAGTVRLVGASAKRIVSSVSELLRDTQAYQKMSEAVNPYGDGRAAPRIVNFLRRFQSEPEAFPHASDFAADAPKAAISDVEAALLASAAAEQAIEAPTSK